MIIQSQVESPGRVEVPDLGKHMLVGTMAFLAEPRRLRVPVLARDALDEVGGLRPRRISALPLAGAPGFDPRPPAGAGLVG